VWREEEDGMNHERDFIHFITFNQFYSVSISVYRQLPLPRLLQAWQSLSSSNPEWKFSSAGESRPRDHACKTLASEMLAVVELAPEHALAPDDVLAMLSQI
jgi:hypothetical protein